MFCRTSPQTTLLENHFLLPKDKRKRLERSWARGFRDSILPLIDEELFRTSFHKTKGRPNKSIRLLVGLHIIKEMSDYTDSELVDALEYNLQVQYALGVESRVAHVCQKTLHNHRTLLLQDGRSQTLFEGVTKGLAELDGLSLGRQRLDSTHVMSNIAVLTRLGLFVETITAFMKELRRVFPEKLDWLDAEYVKRYLERDGYFSDAKRRQARRRLRAVASDLYRLVIDFESDKAVLALASYQTLARLFKEQCELVKSSDSCSCPVALPKVDEREGAGTYDDEDAGFGADDAPIDAASPTPEPVTPPPKSKDEPDSEMKVRLRQGKEISASSQQSPHDPDATYGHKGKGYEAQVTETCEAENPYQVITGISLNGANESDQGAVPKVIDQLESAGLSPDEMVADTGYGSGENIVDCAERGVDLQAPVQDPDAAAKKDRMGEPVEPTVLPKEEEEEEEEEEGVATSPAAPSSSEVEDRPLGLEDFSYNKTYSEVERCPGGQAPVEQTTDESGKTVWSRFSANGCAGCPLAPKCPTRLRKDGVRTLRTRRAKAATACRQREQRSSDFKDRYKIRSGIEATNAELKGRHGARRFRVRSRARMEQSMRLKAMAVNAKRASAYHAAMIRASEQDEAEQALEEDSFVVSPPPNPQTMHADHGRSRPPTNEANEGAPSTSAVSRPPGLTEDVQAMPPTESTTPPAGLDQPLPSPPVSPSPARQHSTGTLRWLGQRLTRALGRHARRFDMRLPPILQGTLAAT